MQVCRLSAFIWGVNAALRSQTQRRTARLAKAVPTFRDVAAEVIREEQAKSTNGKVRYQWDLLLGVAYCSLKD